MAAPIRAERSLDPSRDPAGLLYPDIHDDSFLNKLLAKREFRETKQEKITDKTLQTNVCDVEEFEYTSSQKFVSQFISPNTPYNGILLYHGVGVGKTCSAILAAEAFLQLSPKNKVYILAPPAIQAGFYRTIFDSSRIVFGKEPDQQNTHEGCTGNRYLELTQTLYEREKKDIELRVSRLINKRYSIMGYVAFRNMIRDIKSQVVSTLPAKKKEEKNTILLQRALSGSLFIVDEAHNLRDASDGAEDDDEDIGDRSDASAGKKLTPILREVLQKCEGNKLILMTATPMYNSYKEIISLLNLLLYVDKIPRREPEDDDSEIRLLTDADLVFEKKVVGEKEIEVLTESSEKKLIAIANSHVSYMRGENPKAFPTRLDPQDNLRIKTWPKMNPDGKSELKADEKENVMKLPLVSCDLKGDPLQVIQHLTENLIASKGIGIRTIDTLLQAGNCIFPGEGLEGRVGSEGFQTWFSTKAIGGTFEGTRLSVLPQYIPADPDESYEWMVASEERLGNASPKFNLVINTIKTASGISFVYSRFVENGAVIFCLLLEANGYLPWGRSAPLFSKGAINGPGGKQCAKCEKKQGGHPGFNEALPESRENHRFTQAYYTLLTASNIDTVEKQSLPLSPNNTLAINIARSEENKDGNLIKVVVGSQVSGEGLDLKCLREVHILEGWFHLSKEEQIVGRGIRYCSHNALPKNKRNCTISLYVNTFPPEINKETIDQYSYRTAMNKAVRVGNVSRAIKRGAADCNLNRDAILVTGLSQKPALDEDGNPNMIDSQGNARPVDLNDKDFTAPCDWIACDYACEPMLDLSDKTALPDDNGTYDMFAARFSEQMLIQKLRSAFKKQPWYHWDKLVSIFKDIPQSTLMSLLLKILNNKSLVFENGNLQGRIVFRNNLFLFQPNKIQDLTIPISFRHGVYPVKRDYYEPAMTRVKGTVLKKQTVAQAVPGTGPGPRPASEPGTELALESYSEINVEKAADVWTKSLEWVDSWCKDTAKRETINESISMELSTAILAYLDGDTKERDNIERRLKQLQWWAKAIADSPAAPGGMNDLKRVCKEFIWDSIFKGLEQIGMIESSIPLAEEGGNEQFMIEGSIKATRYLDILTKEPIYFCGIKTACAPSVIKLLLASKKDAVINAKADITSASSIYGFMVIWENQIMFKTNRATNPVGTIPGPGSACSIVSTVKTHRMKLVELGNMLHTYTGNRFELEEEILSTGYRKLVGAAPFCALMEIVLRWMDIRKDLYGGKRYFYRPLASFYSKHKSKK